MVSVFLSFSHLDSSVDLQPAVDPCIVDNFPRLLNLLQSVLDEPLPSEAGVHGHEEDGVELVEDVLGGVEGSSGVEDEAGLAAEGLDELEGAVDVLGRLGKREERWKLVGDTRWRCIFGFRVFLNDARRPERVKEKKRARIGKDRHRRCSRRWTNPTSSPQAPHNLPLSFPLLILTSGWKVIWVAPAAAKSSIILSTGDTIKWTSMGAVTPWSLKALHTMGPIVRLGT